MQFSRILALLALVSSIAAVPRELWKRDSVYLGYRTVNKAEADKINVDGRLVWEDKDYGGGRQLGAGIYTTPNPGGWRQKPGQWVCIISVDIAALDRVSKAWIPSSWNNVNLWWPKDEADIDAYIMSLDKTWDPARTLRMSLIGGYEPALQLLIPPELVMPSGGMNLGAECYEQISELPTTRVVNYDRWKNNKKGSKEPGSDVPPPPIVPHAPGGNPT